MALFLHENAEKVGFVACEVKKKHYFCKLRIMCTHEIEGESH